MSRRTLISGGTKLKKLILIESDLQVGSLWGLSPNPFIQTLPGQPGEHMEITPNKGQLYLLECWKKKIAAIPRVDACVLNGDVIDGMQWRQRGTEAMSTNISDQVKAALELLRMEQYKVKKWYVVKGTDYHEKIEGVSAPDVIAQNLGVDRAYDVLDLEFKVGEKTWRINFVHAIGATSGFYTATPLNAQAMWGHMMGLAGKVPLADLIVRSHVQSYASVEFSSHRVITTPGWQLQTPFMREKNYYRWIPDIGSILVEATETELVVRRLKYPYPTPSTVELE